MLELHIRLNSILYFLEEIQDAVLVAEVASSSFDVFDAGIFMQRRDDDVAMVVFVVKLASSFTHIW